MQTCTCENTGRRRPCTSIGERPHDLEFSENKFLWLSHPVVLCYGGHSKLHREFVTMLVLLCFVVDIALFTDTHSPGRFPNTIFHWWQTVFFVHLAFSESLKSSSSKSSKPCLPIVWWCIVKNYTVKAKSCQ